jgi:hypothetical protein
MRNTIQKSCLQCGRKTGNHYAGTFIYICRKCVIGDPKWLKYLEIHKKDLKKGDFNAKS